MIIQTSLERLSGGLPRFYTQFGVYQEGPHYTKLPLPFLRSRESFWSYQISGSKEIRYTAAETLTSLGAIIAPRVGSEGCLRGP